MKHTKMMSEKDYTNVDTEMLATDPYFREFVLSPNASSEKFWSEWKGRSKENSLLFEEASLIVTTFFQGYQDNLEDEVISRKVESIVSKTSFRHSKVRMLPTSFGNNWWKVAAVLFLGSALIWIVLRNKLDYGTKTDHIASSEVIQSMDKLVTRVNNTNKLQTIFLEDSSIVTLQPGASLSFPFHFDAGSRIVSLEGEAFFEIKRNIKKPFLVHAQNTVTKVLGTSFNIAAIKETAMVTVLVKTGKVSVFKAHDFDSETMQGTASGVAVILTPNEWAVYYQSSGKMHKVQPGDTELAISMPTQQVQIFDDIPVSKVFNQMAEQYGMEIVFDERVFALCPITTIFKEEDLLERINTICEAVGATYTAEGGKIVVSGAGCQ